MKTPKFIIPPIKYFVIFPLSFLLTSCDPGKVVRIYNDTKDDLNVEVDSESCYFIKGRVLMNQDTTAFIDLSEVKHEYERDIYLGVGTWNEDEKIYVQECLETIIITQSGNSFQTENYNLTFTIKGFANRIMEIRISNNTP